MLYKARKKKMLSKEEYLTHLDYGVKTCPAIRDAFKELIDEHFKPKENTSEFKHFKLHISKKFTQKSPFRQKDR